MVPINHLFSHGVSNCPLEGREEIDSTYQVLDLCCWHEIQMMPLIFLKHLAQCQTCIVQLSLSSSRHSCVVSVVIFLKKKGLMYPGDFFWRKEKLIDNLRPLELSWSVHVLGFLNVGPPSWCL